MANSLSNQIRIGLEESLNMNTNKAEIKEFAGFNKRNSPFINGGISPLFKQEKTGTVIDNEGNVYKCENGNFYKNNEVIASGINESHVMRKKIADNINSNDKWTIDGSDNLFIVSDIKTDGSASGTAKITYKNYEHNNVVVYGNIQCGYINDIYDSGINLNHKYNNGNGILYCLTWETPNKGFLYYMLERATGDSFQVLEFDYVTNNTANVKGAIVTRAYEYSIGYYGPSISASQLRIQFVVRDQPTSTNGDLIVFRCSGSNVPTSTNSITYTATKPPYVIRKDSDYLYNTDFSNLNSNQFSPLYTLKFTDNLPVYTVASADSISPIIIPTYKTRTCKCLYDGETVFVNGLVTENSKDHNMTVRNGHIYYGEGCSNINNDITFFKSFISKDKSSFCLLYNNNVLSGISCNSTLVVPFLDIDGEVQRTWINTNAPENIDEISLGQYQQGYIYKSVSDNCFYKLYVECENYHKLRVINDTYIFIDTVNFFNAYNIKTGLFEHIFSDYNNRAFFHSSVTTGEPVDVVMCSGINVNYEIFQNANVSAIFNPFILNYCQKGDIRVDIYTQEVFTENIFNGQNKQNYVDIFLNTDIASTPKYFITLQRDSSYTSQISFYKNELDGVSYPVSTDGNIILTPSLFATFYDSQIGADYIKDGRYYNLIYYEGMPLLAYYYGSGVANSEARFVIQGQSFVIRNGLIYSTTYNNGLMYVNDAIVNVDDLQFIGCVPMAAFFFSPATKSVLAFTGDRNLQTSFEATEMTSVVTYKYVANNNSLYLATSSAVYVLYNTADGSSYIYKIDIANVTDFVALNDGSVALKVGTTWNILSFFEKEDFERIPVKLSTCFYGAGLNRVSTIDCWYIRLFSDTAEKGSVKVKVTTMTNISISSEEQIFPISKEKWQENDGVVYLRYQPKLQRSVGCSLSIESDFAIYDIQASIKPDSAIQITKESGI